MFSGMGSMKSATKLESEELLPKKRIIENFVRQLDFPKWYRGLSTFQIEAGSKLHYAIRDDLEEGTTHRVEVLLNRIGLRPSVRKENIRFVMFLSGGNDIAFLWFIYELFYNTKNDEEFNYSDDRDYSVNEQLILSSIARLDMLFTLRALDRILPPEQPTKSVLRRLKLAKRKSLRQKFEIRGDPAHTETQTTSSARIKYKLPYFDELVRPRPYTQRLTSQRPPYCAKALYADVLRDANYVIPNAHNRWFANYNLPPGKSTGMKMLTERMSELFKAQLPAMATATMDAALSEDMYKRASTSLHELISTEHETQKTQCMHHQILANMERNITDELRVRAHEKCIRYFDPDTPKREERISRIRRQIDKDVNGHLTQFKKLTDRTRSHLLLCSNRKDDECFCGGGAKFQSEGNIYSRYANCQNQNPPFYRERHENMSRITSNSNLNNTEYFIGDCMLSELHRKEKCCRQCIGNNSAKTAKGDKHQHENLSKMQRVRNILHHTPFDCGYVDIKNYDYGHLEHSRNQHSEIFFSAPQEHRPYIFDYQRVFNLKENAQREYLKIINSDLNLEKSNPNAPKKFDEAIKQYAKGTFAKGSDLAAAETSEEYSNSQRLYPYLDIELDYCDPDDAALMQRMLKNALDFLAKDPRYVLASMPDAHKLPSLVNWMEVRYGKVYSRKTLRKLLDEVQPTCHALKQMTVNVMLPSLKQLSRSVVINKNCRNYLMRKTKMLRMEYYDRLKASIMDQSRTLYIACKPNLTPNIKETLFAYLPAREADIHHFRIWRSHEHMPAREEFYKRQCRMRKCTGDSSKCRSMCGSWSRNAET